MKYLSLLILCLISPATYAGELTRATCHDCVHEKLPPYLDAVSAVTKTIPEYLEPLDIRHCGAFEGEYWCVLATDTRDHTAMGRQVFQIYLLRPTSKSPPLLQFEQSGQHIIEVWSSQGFLFITWGIGTGSRIDIVGLVNGRFRQLLSQPPLGHYGGYGTKDQPSLIRDPRNDELSNKIRKAVIDYPPMIAIHLWNVIPTCDDEEDQKCLEDALIYRWDAKKMQYTEYKKVNWGNLFR